MTIDESKAFVPVRIAVMTVTDTRTEETDTSGKLLVERARDAGHEVVAKVIVEDDRASIEKQLHAWIADPTVQVVISTGGTGITARDVTTEAFESLYEKSIPGFGELFRQVSFDSVGTSTLQSRATAGIAQKTLLFALPGSTGACRDAWDRILATQLDSRHRPCNFVELFPRL